MTEILQTCPDVGSKRNQKLVEDVVRSLHFLLLSDPRFLQQVGHNVAPSQLSRSVEVNSDKLSKAGGVVIPRGLGVTVRLQDRIGGHNLVLQSHFLLSLLAGGRHDGEVGDDLLRVLRLASPGLASDEHGLVIAVAHHPSVGGLSNGPQVGWDLVASLAEIDLGDPVSVIL